MSTASLCLPVACHLAGSLAKNLASRTAASVLAAFSGAVLGGASWLVGHVLGLLDQPTKVSLGAKWFGPEEGQMLEVAALLAGPLLAAATIGAVLRQDARRLLRVFGVALPASILAAVSAVALVQRALAIVDEMCTLIMPQNRFEPLLKLTVAVAHPGIPPFVAFAVSSFLVLGTFALWMEMLLRAAVLYIAVFFLPLGLAAFIWPATASITKRFIELVVAIIGSKFVIVATLALGEVMVTRHAGIDATVTGTAVLLLAAFAPFTVLRLAPVVEAAAVSHLEGISRRPAHAALSSGSTARSLGMGAAGILGGFGGGARGGLSASGVGPVDIAQRVGDWSLEAGPADPVGGTGGAPPGPGGSGPSPLPPSASAGPARAGASPNPPAREPAPRESAPRESAPRESAHPAPVVPPLPTVVPGGRTADPEGWSGNA